MHLGHLHVGTGFPSLFCDERHEKPMLKLRDGIQACVRVFEAPSANARLLPLCMCVCLKSLDIYLGLCMFEAIRFVFTPCKCLRRGSDSFVFSSSFWDAWGGCLQKAWISHERVCRHAWSATYIWKYEAPRHVSMYVTYVCMNVCMIVWTPRRICMYVSNIPQKVQGSQTHSKSSLGAFLFISFPNCEGEYLWKPR